MSLTSRRRILGFALLRRIAVGTLPVTCGALIACSEPPPTGTPPSPTLATTSQDVTLGVPDDVRPEEAAFADLARRAPSAAGFSYDSSGGITVRVRDAADNDQARAAIQEFLVSGRLPPSDRGRAGTPVTLKPADFTFKQLAAWRDLAFDNALTRLSGVNSLDLDEVRDRVVLGIDPSTFAATRAAVIARLSVLGVDTTALAFDRVGRHVEDVAMVPPYSVTDQSSDPLAGGLRVRIQQPDGLHSCTLGFVAQRNGQLGLVTASHCTSNTYGVDNNPVHQLDPRQVGTETVDPAGYVCGFFSECRGADAAFFASSGAADMSVGLILKTTFTNGGGLSGGTGSLIVDQADPYWIVTAEENNDVYAGQEVHKLGITTGWTHGAMKQTCVDHYLSGNHLIRCTYEAWYVADHGDSGAPVFQFDSFICSRCVKLVGVHNGRGEVGNDQARFSKLWRIKSDLGGSWVVTRGVGLATPVPSGVVSNGHPVLSWDAVPGAQLYRVQTYYKEYVCDDELGVCFWRDRWDIVATTSALSFTDNSASVSTYSGFSSTGALGERAYWVRAESSTDFSAASARVYFQP